VGTAIAVYAIVVDAKSEGALVVSA